MGSSATEEFPPIQNPFLEFRAGKMRLEGSRVLPDSRKGLVRIGRGEEGLVHFQWLDRSQNIVEDDQIVFPEEAVFEKVNQSAGRVYILKFHTDDRKLFFWMQEPNADNDIVLCSSVNLYLNQPLEAGEEEIDASTPQQSSDVMATEHISPRTESFVVPSTGGAANSDVTSSGPVKLTDLQRILSSIGSSDDMGDPDAGLGLGDILKPELILPIIEDLPVEQQFASYLPEGSWTPHDLVELLQSPPFRQQVDSFTYMLRTGQMDLSQFGIDPTNYKFTVSSFLEALEDSVSEASGSEDTRKQTREPMDEGQ